MQILHKSLGKYEAQTTKKNHHEKILCLVFVLFNSQRFKLDFDGAESF